MNTLKITILVENTAGKLGVLAEHGLSFLIETGGEKILFDTGQGFVLKHNLKRLFQGLENVKTVVLSHGHYDHTGGLSAALSMMNNPAIYSHPAAIQPKFGRNADGSARFIGMSELNKDALLHSNWIRTTQPIELSGGLRLTGTVPRIASFEDTGGPFYRDAACTYPDPIEDDQAAFIGTGHGTVVILGCAHAGVVNTLRYIQSLTDNRPIHTVIGGMHLHSASEERIHRTLTALRELNVRRMFPCHCTGFAAAARLASEFPGQVSACPVGTMISAGEDS
ncbi:MAG: MBL fold metallo-hydrolase [Kiritimatiellaeota bacterium]|nr:MBL fold metallo-hydrolase [Kiritimatiellota bacterium]